MTPICYHEGSTDPGSIYRIRAINLASNENYFAEVSGPTSYRSSGQITGPSSSQLIFDVGSKPDPGSYSAVVKKSSDGSQQCTPVVFHVEDDGDIVSDSPSAPSGTVPGASGAGSGSTPTSAAGKPCSLSGQPGVDTAIGCIPTDPKELIKIFIRLSTGAGGGIAFLLMIAGAFQMITSAGNPEALKSGQGRFTAAVIGLLFVIFAVLLMQIIGADILDLPGF